MRAERSRRSSPLTPTSKALVFSAENTGVFVCKKREAPHGGDQSPRVPHWPSGGDKTLKIIF